MTWNPPASVEDAVRLLEDELSIKRGFLEALFQEDDWSFIIKSHAFLEAAMSHALVVATNAPELQSIYSRLEFSNGRTGKVAFGKALGLIESDENRLLRQFSELRNRLVHDVTNVQFDLDEHVRSLDGNQLEQFARAYGYFETHNEFEYQGSRIDVKEFARLNPKRAIWFSVMNFAAIIYLRKDVAKLRSIIAALRTNASETEG